MYNALWMYKYVFVSTWTSVGWYQWRQIFEMEWLNREKSRDTDRGYLWDGRANKEKKTDHCLYIKACVYKELKLKTVNKK